MDENPFFNETYDFLIQGSSRFFANLIQEGMKAGIHSKHEFSREIVPMLANGGFRTAEIGSRDDALTALGASIRQD